MIRDFPRFIKMNHGKHIFGKRLGTAFPRFQETESERVASCVVAWQHVPGKMRAHRAIYKDMSVDRTAIRAKK